MTGGIDHWSDENPDRWRTDTLHGNCPDCGFALAQGDDGGLYCPDCGEVIARQDDLDGDFDDEESFDEPFGFDPDEDYSDDDEPDS